MAFLRALRPLTALDENPTVLIPAHPVKNATDDNLVPYGGGAILNEVDGNLTMLKTTATRSTFHWCGKIRGIEFDPLEFETRLITCDGVRDAKGALIPQPFLECCDPVREKDVVKADGDQRIRLLAHIAENPGLLQVELSKRLDIRSGTINKWIKIFESKKWIEPVPRGGYKITPKGRKELDQDRKTNDPDAPF
jgi:Winged helix-turn-helix DNA-binding